METCNYEIIFDNGLYTEDVSSIALHLELEQEDGSLGGEVMAERLKEKGLNKKTLDYLLAHPELIPEDWKDKFIYFWGTILRGPDGYRCVLCLYRNDGQWNWDAFWLEDDWLRHRPSAVLVPKVKPERVHQTETILKEVLVRTQELSRFIETKLKILQ